MLLRCYRQQGLMSQWRLEVRHRTFSRTGFDKLSDVEFKFTLYYYKFWCILQRSSLNYCCHLFCLGVSGALQILCQDHKDIQSELTNLKVLQQNQLNNQKMSNFIIFKKYDCLSFKSEMQKLQETEMQSRDLEFRQKQYELEKLQVLLPLSKTPKCGLWGTDLLRNRLN